MVARACNLNPQAAKAAGERQASQGYEARPCLKKEKSYKGATKNSTKSSLRLSWNEEGRQHLWQGSPGAGLLGGGAPQGRGSPGTGLPRLPS